MKKIAALLLAVVMLLGLAACGNETLSGNNGDRKGEEMVPIPPSSICSVWIKINPEFLLYLDENNSIAGMSCLNEDAEKAFEGVDVTNVDFENGLHILLDAVYDAGYISGNELVIQWDISAASAVEFDKSDILEVFSGVTEAFADEKELDPSVSMETAEDDDAIGGEDEVDTEDTADTEDKAEVNEPAETGDAIGAEDTASAGNAASQNGAAFERNVLYREDFEVPDIFGTGYTNLIDYYNVYPNGNGGGSAGNLGIAAYYGGWESFLSAEDALAFKTWRGIGLGSSAEDLFEAYGDGNIEPPHDGLAGLNDGEHTVQYFVYYWGKIGSGAIMDIRFYIDQNDAVMGLDIGAIYEENVTENADPHLYQIVNG